MQRIMVLFGILALCAVGLLAGCGGGGYYVSGGYSSIYRTRHHVHHYPHHRHHGPHHGHCRY